MQMDQQVLKMRVALNCSAHKVAMGNLRGDLNKLADLEVADLEVADLEVADLEVADLEFGKIQ